MHVAACKEFYVNSTVYLSKKKEVARSRVRGVKIELDSMILASILGVPGNNRICEYIKEVWEESKFCKPLEITKKFANDESITTARRVKSIEMKPFQRFLHFVVMKNLVPRFGKRDTTSFMDLTNMDHLVTRRLVNLPRVMLRHIAYVLLVPAHALSYDTFLNMCQLKREQGVWWLEIGGIRRRDDEDEAPAENEENVEVNEGEEVQQDFDWEAVIDDVELQEEEVHEIQGESGSAENFYDAEDEVQGSDVMIDKVSEVPAPVHEQPKETTASGVDPSGLVGSISDSDFAKLQAEFDRAHAERLQTELDQAHAENARL
ncbi:hypothetical protein Dimus_018869 [Dionaea muscipula]